MTRIHWIVNEDWVDKNANMRNGGGARVEETVMGTAVTERESFMVLSTESE